MKISAEVRNEIEAAFGDAPRPRRCVPPDLIGTEEGSRLELLAGKAWPGLANDLELLREHWEEDFHHMTLDCFYYFLPGYLLGVVRYPELLGVTNSMLAILCPAGSAGRGFGLEDRLSVAQKRAVANWLGLLLYRARLAPPDYYGEKRVPPHYERAFDHWKPWTTLFLADGSIAFAE